MEQHYRYTYDDSQTSTIDTSQQVVITIPISPKGFNDTVSIRTVLRKKTMNKRQWKKLSKNSAVIKQFGSYVVAYQEVKK